MVRDAKTGEIVVKPPKDQLWLYRQKAGLGRASKNDWTILKEVGTAFFEDMDHYRTWRFSFRDYYDVYVWDLRPGRTYPELHNCVQEVRISEN